MPPATRIVRWPPLLAACWLTGAVIVGAPVRADEPLRPGAPRIWNELGPSEQQFLKHHSERWNSYSPSVRHRLRGQARRLMEMEPQQLERLRRRAYEFRQLPPPRRRALCQRFEQEHGYLPPPCLDGG